MKVLFICTGNTCRSPMAEKILLNKAKENNLQIEVKSAGIAAAKGGSASKHARAVMRDYGLSEKHQSKQVSEELLNWADLIITMTIGHKRVLIEQNPALHEKIFSLNEFILKQSDTMEPHEIELLEQNLQRLDVGDPFGKDLLAYKRTAEEINEGIEHLLKSEFFKR